MLENLTQRKKKNLPNPSLQRGRNGRYKGRRIKNGAREI